MPVWDSKNKEWLYLKSEDDKYKNVDEYLNAVRSNLGAIGLIDRNRITKPKELSGLEGGDIIVYDLRNHNNSQYTGHTRNVLENDSDNKKITVGEGHLSGPVQETTYSYHQILNDWNGPVEGKGRTWNWKEIAR